MLIKLFGSIREPRGSSELETIMAAASGFLGKDGFYPILVVEIPTYSLADTFLKSMGRHPAEIALEFGGVNGIAAIVTRTILDEGNKLPGIAAKLGRKFVNEVGDEFHDADIGPFVMAANVVGLGV